MTVLLLLVYQGEHDTSTKLTNDEFERMIDFTRNLFTPTTHEQYNNVKKQQPDLIELAGPVMGPDDLDKVLETDDSDAKAVLRRINSLKVLRNDTSPEAFTRDVIGGYVAVVERGEMGLTRA